MQIQIHQGHTFPVATSPDWNGTIEDFWANNEELTFADIREMKKNLANYGYHRIGGGAQGCFTVMTPHAAKLNALGVAPPKGKQ